MCPCYAPHCTFVPLQRLGQPVLLAINFEDLDGLVGGTGRQSSAVVIEDCIVLGGRC